MDDEFEIIERYLSLCVNFSESDIDQTVPRQSPLAAPDSTLDYDSSNSTITSLQPIVPFSILPDRDSPSPAHYNQVVEFNFNDHFLDNIRQSLEMEQEPLYEHSGHSMKSAAYDQELQKTVPTVDQSALGLSSYDSMSMEDKIIDVEAMLVSQTKQEVISEATYLNISSDPKEWSLRDVNRWLDWICSKQNSSKPNLTLLEMDGYRMCTLSESHFVAKYPEFGAFIYKTLGLWKTVFQSSNTSYNIPQPLLDSTQFMDDFYQPSCASPSLSNSSDSSSNGSPNTLSEKPIKYQARPKTNSTYTSHHGIHEHKRTIQLWQFLKELLKQTDQYGNCIKWLDRSKGIFKIEDSTRVAKEWGKRKNRPAMNYDKLSRSIRQYYRKNIIKKTENTKRLVYQFCTPYL